MFCEDIGEGARSPIVVCGESGVGKSALLANWARRRREQAEYMRHGQPGGGGSRLQEFVFEHYAEASRAATRLQNVLYRLEHGLKVHFSLREARIKIAYYARRPKSTGDVRVWGSFC